MKKNLKAFTLAEILITLSIIGVVAALTIPALIQRTGNEEYVSRFNKTYSTLSQATEMIMTENGAPKTWLTDADGFYDIYRKHLRNAKECGSAGTECIKKTKVKYLNGDDGDMSVITHAVYRTLILSDGTQISFDDSVVKDCNIMWGGTRNFCAHIRVDLNGDKEPNKVGRDIFSFALKNEGLVPNGCDYDECQNTGNGQGWGCACRIIQDGDMNY